MNTLNTHLRGRALMLLLVLACAAGAAFAKRPIDPLPLPLYSFDLSSPSVINGLFAAGDILAFDGNQPVVRVPAERLGLHSPQDDLDSLSAPNTQSLPPMFALVFSIDRLSVGVTPPDPELVHACIPYNAWDQARRGQAAGDAFESLSLYTSPGTTAGLGLNGYRVGRTGHVLDDRGSNNTLVINNYDEGGTEFGAQPPSHAYTNYTGPLVAQDNVDAFARLIEQPPGHPVLVYFSLTRASPSLPSLSGATGPSGANLFFNPDPLGGATTVLYAAWQELGLVLPDDIDAVLVCDRNQNGRYDGADFVLFSLTPDSPSLGTIPGASPTGAAADVFIARPGAAVQVFAHAADYGLGHPLDNIDALDFTPCTDGTACGIQHGIGLDRGDLNCDDHVDFADINPFVLALNGQAGYEAQYPNCYWFNADCNCDGAVNFDDINPFVALLAGGE